MMTTQTLRKEARTSVEAVEVNAKPLSTGYVHI